MEALELGGVSVVLYYTTATPDFSDELGVLHEVTVRWFVCT